MFIKAFQNSALQQCDTLLASVPFHDTFRTGYSTKSKKERESFDKINWEQTSHDS